ncbi:MAG: putative toxin-antitoxin system toxin component, PIN family [bacterium]
MKLVLDSNVIIAAFSARGICHSLLEHCLYSHSLFFSESLLKEIKIKLQTKINIPKPLVQEIISFLENHAHIANPKPLEQKVCRDPDDDNVLSLAITGGADYIVSGDNDLSVLKQYKDIPILSPREFWETLRRKDAETST